MGTPLKIAIAEDEADILRFFRAAVVRLGHEVHVAVDNGQELVSHCLSQPPDLILTDIQMPLLDGIEATRRICRQHAVPVIVVSSCPPAQVGEQENCDHVVAFLTKPVKIHDLESAILEATGSTST